MKIKIRLEIKDKEISKLKEEADILTDYAVRLRYPNDLFEPTTLNAKEAYQIAKKIKNISGDPIWN